MNHLLGDDNPSITNISGSGLGMTIVHSLIKKMNGNINVESTLGKGSKFTIVLELEVIDKKQILEESSNREQEINLEDLNLKGKKILLVEDNELNREIAVELLRMTKAEIDTAENGKIGVEKFKNSKIGEYSLIFMDVQMPVLNGYEATKSIRFLSREDAGNIPIVAMTANAFVEDIQRGKEVGMDEYLSKPIDINELAKVLKKIEKKQNFFKK